jgi:hypothetical protein
METDDVPLMLLKVLNVLLPSSKASRKLLPKDPHVVAFISSKEANAQRPIEWDEKDNSAWPIEFRKPRQTHSKEII